MMDGGQKVAMALIAGLTAVAMSLIAAWVVVEMNKPFGPNYITINDEPLMCATVMIGKDPALDCNWKAWQELVDKH